MSQKMRGPAGSSLSMGMSGTPATKDPLVKNKDLMKSSVQRVVSFFLSAPSFTGHEQLKQLTATALPAARLVRAMFQHCFDQLLGLELPDKGGEEKMLEYLKLVDYPFVIPKSALTNPNNAGSWPYNLGAILHCVNLLAFLRHSSDDQYGGQQEGGEESLDGELSRMVDATLARDVAFQSDTNKLEDLHDEIEELQAEIRIKDEEIVHTYGSLDNYYRLQDERAAKLREAKCAEEELRELQQSKDGLLQSLARVNNDLTRIQDSFRVTLRAAFPSLQDVQGGLDSTEQVDRVVRAEVQSLDEAITAANRQLLLTLSHTNDKAIQLEETRETYTALSEDVKALLITRDNLETRIKQLEGRISQGKRLNQGLFATHQHLLRRYNDHFAQARHICLDATALAKSTNSTMKKLADFAMEKFEEREKEDELLDREFPLEE